MSGAPGNFLPQRPFTRVQARIFQEVAQQAARVGAAYAANQAVRIAQEYAFPEPTIDDAADNVDPRDVYPKERMNRSRWVGNFKKPKPYKDNWEVKCLKSGFVWHDETYGKVSDPNSVYITHSTFDSNLLSQVIAMTWLRKVLKKAGIDIKDRSYIIPLNNIAVGTGGRFEYHEQNPVTGAVTTVGYETVAGETLTTLLTSFGTMTTSIKNILNNASNLIPYKLCFYSFDIAAGPASKFTLSAMLDLDCEVLDIYANSDIKIQNRTAPDTAVEGEQAVDRSDIQPLVGSLYDFNGDPKLKKIGTNNANYQKLQGVLAANLKLDRSDSFTEDSFDNRPPAQIFSNCTKKSNVILQPGDIKRGHVFYHVKGLVKKLMPDIRIEASGGVNVAYHVKCAAQMLVFEELMRTEGTNKVVIAFERKLRVGCMSYTRKNNVPLLPPLTLAAKNLTA